MHRAVLDTNILVSALQKPEGKPAEVMRWMALNKILVFYNFIIFAEYKIILPRPKFDFDIDDMDNLLELFRLQGRIIDTKASTFPLPDETDRIFYDTAKTADAYLVTGNLKHYPKKQFVVTPAEFLQIAA
jgi:putative PIN family toxin of toxin-antitoxin system